MQNQQKKLIAAYHFYDFGKKTWEEFWKKDKEDPVAFHELPFPKRLGLENKIPETWDGAITISTEENVGLEVIPFLDKKYPLIKDLYFTPAVLYQWGANVPTPQSSIAVVGTRKPTVFGVSSTINFSEAFVKAGLGIVSGLARGIDTIAHEVALKHQAYTLAILGSGLKYISPSENKNLVKRIVDSGGTVLSMFPPRCLPHKTNFPRRNYLIAALSAGVLVVEGSVKSGAAITGKAALEIGREVATLTQDYRSAYGAGAIVLLQQRANAVRNPQEAIDAFGLPWGGEFHYMPLHNKKMRREFSLEEFQQARNIPVQEAIALLEDLCLTGALQKIGENRYMFSKDE